MPTSGAATGGIPAVSAETSVPTYAPEVDMTSIPGMYVTAGVPSQTAKSASVGPPASGVDCASDEHPAITLTPAAARHVSEARLVRHGIEFTSVCPGPRESSNVPKPGVLTLRSVRVA